MKTKILIALGSLLLSANAFSQTFNKEKLDQYFNNLEQNNKFMGSIAVSKNGNILYSKTIGFADVNTQQKANENTKYRIGSISKTYTAVLVMKAVEANKIKLSETIEKYFPSIINAKKITIEQLLSHRSGIHNFTDDEDYLTWNTKAKTEKEMVEMIAKKGSDFEPNSKFSYSNSNYVLLTYILEKAYKKNYSEILKAEITQPLNLKNTYLGSKINSKNNEAQSYKFDKNWLIEPETDISIPLGAGGIESTPKDLTAFSDALFSGRLVSNKSLELMKTMKDGYGLGLFQVPFYDYKGFGHTGGIDGFTSTFTHFDQDNISFALTSNASTYNNNNIAIAVLSAVYNKNYDIPNLKTITLKPEDLVKYIGVYSTTQIPLKIEITNNNGVLTAQATGQSSFPLDATDKDIFAFEKAGVVLEFKPENKTLILKQNGAEFNFIKE